MDSSEKVDAESYTKNLEKVFVNEIRMLITHPNHW